MGNEVFVITGAGSGIGRAVALQLLERGDQVAAVDVRGEALEELAVTAKSEKLSIHVTDITDRAAVAALPERVLSRHGAVTGVINVAGIIHRFAPLAELSLEEIERVMAINFWGTLNMVKAFLPTLLTQTSSAIVNVSSMGSLIPSPGQGAYGASKAAVRLLTDALFVELRSTPVKVVLAIPGSVATGILQNSGVDLGPLAAAAASSDHVALITTPEDAAAQIMAALNGDEYRALIGDDARDADRRYRLDPEQALLNAAG